MILAPVAITLCCSCPKKGIFRWDTTSPHSLGNFLYLIQIESVHVVSELERRLMQRCQELDSMLQSRGMDVWEGVHLENSTPAEVGRRARNMVQQCSPAEQAAAFQEHLSTSTSDIYQHLQVKVF